MSVCSLVDFLSEGLVGSSDGAVKSLCSSFLPLGRKMQSFKRFQGVDTSSPKEMSPKYIKTSDFDTDMHLRSQVRGRSRGIHPIFTYFGV